jgi:hypothetical protein
VGEEMLRVNEVLEKKKFTNSSKSKIKRCIYCKIKLVAGENCSESEFKNSWYVCKKCSADWYRKHEIACDGNKSLYGNKRDFPKNNKCEICHKEFIGYKYSYHHWNDRDISKGIWCHNNCHTLAEKVDNNLDLVYRKLKETINAKNL